MNKHTNIFLNLSTVKTTTVYNSPVILKGISTVNFILTGINEVYNNVLFLDINWGDGSNIIALKKDTVYDYRNQSIFNEVLYGKIGGSVCTVQTHSYANNSNTYNILLTATFTLTYNSGEVATFYQPFSIYYGSFYDDIKEYVAINSQMLPISANTTFVNFESKQNIQVVPSLLTTTIPSITAAPPVIIDSPGIEIAIAEVLTESDVGVNHIFTSSYIPIDITSISGNLYTNIVAGANPTLTLQSGINYNFNINTPFSIAIRSISPTNSATVPKVYNNDTVNGRTNTTLMFTPTAVETLYYVKVSNPNVYGVINIQPNTIDSPIIDYPVDYYQLSHLFTSSYNLINITSVGSNLSTNITTGTNPTITIKNLTNYNFNISATFPVAIRKSPTDITNILGIYNNNAFTGSMDTTLMFTPTAVGTLYYVNVNNTSTYGTINIID